ncbi:MAG: putative serine esterase-domain-containing protein [Benniella sp.]|nr:MAG: putative serine esterase-domain-containing protein [Benniella sp.]
MTLKPVLAIQHKLSLSVGGIVRYRIKVLPSQASAIETLQFRIRNSSPVYRNITPGSGPWKLSVALVRNPDKTPVVPELVPSVGCAQVCRLDATVDHDNQAENTWELEVLSEMVFLPNWIDIKVEVFAVPREGATELIGTNPTNTDDNTTGETSDVEAAPHILLPNYLSCDYKDTEAICGPTFPKHTQPEDDDLHLVLLTHGIHGSWLDMLYIKEQIDAKNVHSGKTVTFLTDTNHAGTEEGIQMAGQRVAMDILEFTGYLDTENGKDLRRSLSTVAHQKTLSKSKESSTLEEPGQERSGTATKRHHASRAFPRGFSKVSLIGHSLGGLINIYALGYIEDVTKGAFFNAIQPVHFVTMASPLLGVCSEHPWVVEFALTHGTVGQTGKDLALANRSSTLRRSASLPAPRKHRHADSGSKNKETSHPKPLECALDHGPEPLLLAMAQPGSVSHTILKRFKDRTAYANIENDMAVRFNTSSMMGIPTFDMEQFFSPEGNATQPRKGYYYSALTSAMALLFPNIPPKAKFLNIADAPTPIAVVSHVEATPLDNNEDESPSYTATKSKLDLMQLVAKGYHTEMNWTKIGVFIEDEAHVQIVVRRKWFNLDGWKCVDHLVERFDFT